MKLASLLRESNVHGSHLELLKLENGIDDELLRHMLHTHKMILQFNMVPYDDICREAQTFVEREAKRNFTLITMYIRNFDIERAYYDTAKKHIMLNASWIAVFASSRGGRTGFIKVSLGKSQPLKYELVNRLDWDNVRSNTAGHIVDLTKIDFPA